MIIPKLKEVYLKDGSFNAIESLRITFDFNNKEAAFIADYLSERLLYLANLKAETEDRSANAIAGDQKDVLIILDLSGNSNNNQPEGYTLEVTTEKIIIAATKTAGLFYGVQTLLKLINPDKEKSCLKVPCMKIFDAPAFVWRGMLIDCSRHFISKEYIIHLIDLMAQLKMNVLHWHLTDDHGWRVEIKKYPQLTQTGAYIEQGEAREGYYTQEDIKEVVEYAKSRYIEVVPELDIPGHSFAVMKSLPWLCCTGNPERNKGHQRDLYCAGKKETFDFLKDIVDELMELFPSKYIHLGGDEAPKERWAECEACQKVIKDKGLKNENELQGYLLNEVSDYMKTKGRIAVCWDEAAECGVSKDTVIHWWRYNQHGDAPVLNAIHKGHNVLASPNGLTYLSFPVDPDENFKPIRTFDLPRAYQAKYIPDGLTEEEKKQVLGAECCVWTEHLTEYDIDRMLFPRILACSELMWLYPEQRDFHEFMERTRAEQKRLELDGIEFGPYFKLP